MMPPLLTGREEEVKKEINCDKGPGVKWGG